MKLKEIVNKFKTTPFLFVGSGLTRRYYNLPDWESLLKHFAHEISNDDFSYSYFKNKAEKFENKQGLLPKVAELIQIEYENQWFKDPSIRHVDEQVLSDIKSGNISPFKAEVAQYIKKHSVLNADYKDEVKLLCELSIKSISGVITTNYDTFLEDNFSGYVKFVGQKQLVFSAIQGFAEIFKIHGSVESPNSIVINEKDYIDFENNSAYLAAKLLTIFMEYPIVFIGYSLSDKNIQNIIKSIIDCLDDTQSAALEDRFIFVEYKKDMTTVEITPHTIVVGENVLTITRVITADFKPIYSALSEKKSKLSAKILRRFKQELYDFALTSPSTSKILVAEFEDNRVRDDDLVLAIGKFSDFGLKGLKGLTSNEWYRDIVMEDLNVPADALLTYAFDYLIGQNSGKLPLNKYLYLAKKNYPDCRKIAAEQDFENIISDTIKKNRTKYSRYSSVKEAWNSEKNILSKATLAIAHLEREKISVDELENVLKEIFTKNKEILSSKDKKDNLLKSNIRRLIRIYDYLKWGTKNSMTKAPND